MIRFYYHPSPNPAKVALYLEESGLDYEMVPVDTRRGEQHDPAFKAINPNAKTPAIVDTQTDATVFDSSAILLYLTEKTGQFLPPDGGPATRGQMMSWLMFVATGIGPYSGQCVHFRHFAPELPYAINRYRFEAERHWGILDDHLENRRYMIGDTYTVVDMAVWGWCGPVPFIMGDDAWNQFPNVKRLFDEISARPAAQRAAALKEQHEFKTEMDDAARQHMFPQNTALG